MIDAPKIPKVEDMDTLRTARDHSLDKWTLVRYKKNELWSFIDALCGLCQYGKARAWAAGKDSLLKCEYCGSGVFCDKLTRDFYKAEDLLDELIERVLNYLKSMDVTEKD